MLSLTSDLVIRHAIVNGREDTEMPAFGEQLSATEIDAVTAFIRSRATGWAVEKPVLRSPPAVEDYILNPASAAPEFDLKDGLYVSSADLDAALQANKRMVLLDTRTTSQWQMAHIEGSVPIPYYYDRREAVFDDLPKDGTWIVTYCECPRAAAESVNRKLVANGFECGKASRVGYPSVTRFQEARPRWWTGIRCSNWRSDLNPVSGLNEHCPGSRATGPS
jgi:rhodanese-related sulfurtransferase